jgi:cytidylate kinase
MTDKPLTTEEMFKVETCVLKDIANNESCVVAGRSGFFIFRNIPNHLSVLIQAPMKNRIERVMKKQEKNATDAQKLIEQVDRMRENYIKRYTGTSRYDTRNYDLVINMEDLTEDEAVDIIMGYIEKQQ